MHKVSTKLIWLQSERRMAKTHSPVAIFPESTSQSVEGFDFLVTAVRWASAEFQTDILLI